MEIERNSPLALLGFVFDARLCPNNPPNALLEAHDVWIAARHSSRIRRFLFERADAALELSRLTLPVYRRERSLIAVPRDTRDCGRARGLTVRCKWHRP